MGWPALLGLALAGAGAGMQASASAGEEEAMTKKVQEELERQKKFRDTSQTKVTEHIKENAPQVTQQQVESGAKQALSDYNRLMESSAAATPAFTPDQSSYMVPSATQQRANATQNQAAAQMAGWRGSDLQRAMGNIRTGSTLGEYANYARGSQNVLPLEVRAAQGSEEGLRSAGMGMGLLGSIVSMAGGLASAGSDAAAAAETVPTYAATPYAGGAYTVGADLAPVTSMDLMDVPATIGPSGAIFEGATVPAMTSPGAFGLQGLGQALKSGFMASPLMSSFSQAWGRKPQAPQQFATRW